MERERERVMERERGMERERESDGERERGKESDGGRKMHYCLAEAEVGLAAQRASGILTEFCVFIQG